jgi:hypothetical protein
MVFFFVFFWGTLWNISYFELLLVFCLKSEHLNNCWQVPGELTNKYFLSINNCPKNPSKKSLSDEQNLSKKTLAHEQNY